MASHFIPEMLDFRFPCTKFCKQFNSIAKIQMMMITIKMMIMMTKMKKKKTTTIMMMLMMMMILQKRDIEDDQGCHS